MAPRAAFRKSGRKRAVSSTNSSIAKKKKKQRSGVVVCEQDDDCVISPIVVLKNKCDMRRYEMSEDCFILDFDPFAASGVKDAKLIDEDVTVISEKGQVACRDYPHSRHLCLQFPFDKTPHESYCKLCYCYVCDTPAPCKYWKIPLPVPGHCHASDREAEWKRKRELIKKTANLNPG